MDFNHSKTKENLARTFACLCQDNAKLTFLKNNARKEKFYYIHDILQNIADIKMAHAEIIYCNIIENLLNKKENIKVEASFPFEQFKLKNSLQDFFENEEYEAKNIFPHFAKIAQDEGFKNIKQLFELLSIATQNIAKKLKILSNRFQSKQLYSSNKKTIWECSFCGYTQEDKKVWEYCPLCKNEKGIVIFNLNETEK